MSGARICIHDDGYGRLYLKWWADDSGLWRQILESFKSRFPTHHDRAFSAETKTWSVPRSRYGRLAEWVDYWFEPEDQQWGDDEPAGEYGRSYSRWVHLRAANWHHLLRAGLQRTDPSRNRGRPASACRGLNDLSWLADTLLTSQLRGSVGVNCGGCRILVACSKAKASLMSFGSLKRPPIKEMPTGSPNEKPAGTLTIG
jgi:hypothetical protein